MTPKHYEKMQKPMNGEQRIKKYGLMYWRKQCLVYNTVECVKSMMMMMMAAATTTTTTTMIVTDSMCIPCRRSGLALNCDKFHIVFTLKLKRMYAGSTNI